MDSITSNSKDTRGIKTHRNGWCSVKNLNLTLRKDSLKHMFKV